MSDFTIFDGFILMIAAMATVFAVLIGLWALLVIVKKVLESKESTQPVPTNNQSNVSSNQEKSAVEPAAEQGSIPAEKVALIMSLVVDKHKRDKN